jgi:ribosomal RNA-processing protein 36
MQEQEICFGDLLKIRNTVGSKAFHSSIKQINKSDPVEAEVVEKEEPSSFTLNSKFEKKPVDVKAKKPEAKERRSKNAPQEVTSKKPVTRRRMILNTEVKARDPRFDSLTGTYNPALFERSYGFVHDLQAQELAAQKKALRGSTDETLRKQTDVLESAIKLREHLRKKQESRREWKKKEAELVQSGKKPYFVKKSVERTQRLVGQFANIPKDKIDKVLEKKRKRNASKQQVKIPKTRRSEAS